MAGFLSKLDKKGPKPPSTGEDLLVATGTAPQAPVPPISKPTQLVTTGADVGSAEALLAELKAEGESLRNKPAQAATAATKPAPVVTANVTGNSTSATKANAKIRIVQSTASGEAPKKKSQLFDESLPWWLTDPVVSSPQVDLLVPAARQVLNEIVGEGIPQSELPDAIRRATLLAVERLSSEVRFSGRDIQEGTQQLLSLMTGKGPLQPLYDDPAVTDVYLDGYQSIKCVRRGQALETPFRFRSPSEFEAYITAMLQSVERVLNMTSPIVDCVLNDQWRSRINAVHSSLLDGDESALVIRVPRLQQISFYDLLRTKTLPATLAAWMAELVSCGESNILVMGPTGSGKTTMTTALLSAVGSDERICTIEDVPEIFVPTTHLEKLVSRPDNSQGEGAVGMERLLRAALRRAPHRIVVGEIRDKEGPLFLKALETGHAGSVATIHADNPRDGLWRLLDVVAAYENAPQESIQRRIARSLHVLIAMKKINGRPCLTEISEVHPPVSGEFVVKQIVKFVGEEQGKRSWRVMANHSIWLDRLAERGVSLQPGPGLLPMERLTDMPAHLER